MRVEMIKSDSIYELECEVNRKIRNYNNDDIIDIKYSGSGSVQPYGTMYYSVMIIFK